MVTGATGAVATHSATVTLSAPGSGPTAQITATLGANNYVTVSWQTTNATSTWITANGAYYAVGASGSAGITVSGPTTFTLTAQAPDGRRATSVATVGATQPGNSAPTAQITATMGANNYVTVTLADGQRHVHLDHGERRLLRRRCLGQRRDYRQRPDHLHPDRPGP